jgi:hypothetical protein
MSKKHPQNGPSLSKAPPKKLSLTTGAASPDRKETELEEAMRTAARLRRIDQNTNKIGLFEALRREGYLPRLPKKK